MDQWEVGQKVCIRGEGTAALAHRHGRIERFTKTLIVVKGTSRGKEFTERFRSRKGLPPIATPQSDYGGLTLHATCDRRRA